MTDAITLSGIDYRILEQVQALSRSWQTRNPSGAAYCWPGRKWLAERAGCNVWTISRHTARLARAGYLRVVHRRPVAGRWSSNLYVLLGPAARSAAAAAASLHAVLHRVRGRAHQRKNQYPIRESARPETAGSALETPPSRLRPPPGGRSRPPDTPTATPIRSWSDAARALRG